MKKLAQQIKKAYSLTRQKGHVLPILDYSFLKDGELTMTDLQNWVSIKVPFSAPEPVLLDTKYFAAVLSTMTEIPFISAKNDISVKAGNDKYSFEKQDIGDFPKLLTGESYRIGTINDLSKIEAALKFTSNDDLRPNMTYIYLVGGKIFSTDAHMLYFDNHDPFTEQVAITKTTARLMLLFGGIYTAERFGESYLRFTSDKVMILQRFIDDNPPKYEAVIPKEYATIARMAKGEFKQSISKALAVTNTITKQVVLNVNGSVKINSEDPDYLTVFETEIPAVKTGPNIKIGFNAAFLLKAISMIDDYHVELKMNEPQKAAIINDKFLIMPIMLNE